MKNIIILIILCLFISSCSFNNGEENKTYNSTIMPEPFCQSYNSGGDGLRGFYGRYESKFTILSSPILDLADQNDVNNWISEHNKLKSIDYNTEPITILSFVKQFNIPENELREAVSLDKYCELTDEDIKIIYSNDSDLIMKHFKNQYSLMHNHKLYTAEWIYKHNIYDYIKEGLPADEVEYCLNSMKVFPLTDEAIAAIDKKIITIPEIYNSDFVFDESYDESPSTTAVINNSYDDITVNTNELPTVTTTTGADYEGNYISTTAD